MQKIVLELDSEAVQAAEAAGLNLSTVLLEALYRKLPDLHAEQRQELGQRWLAENREAIEAINRRVEENGFVFSDGARTF